jgi:hypothetical protein
MPHHEDRDGERGAAADTVAHHAEDHAAERAHEERDPDTASVESSSLVGLLDGKKTWPIVVAKKPYTAKSNHSMKLPNPAATAIRRMPAERAAERSVGVSIQVLPCLISSSVRHTAHRASVSKTRRRCIPDDELAVSRV